MNSTLKRRKSIELAGRVDLGLVRGLRLPEHRRGVERVAPRPGEQLGGAQEDRGALLPRPARPVLPGRRGRVDRLRARARRRPGGRRRARARVSCGITAGVVLPVVTSLPPITSGISIRSPRICSSRACSARAPGSRARVADRLVAGRRRAEDRRARSWASAPRRGRSAVDEHPDHEAERRGPEVEPTNVQLAAASATPTPSTASPPTIPSAPEPARHLARAERGQRGADDHGRAQAAPGAATQRVASRRAPPPGARAATRRRARRCSRRSRPGRSG